MNAQIYIIIKMETKDTTIRLVVGTIVIMVLLTIALNKPNNSIPPTNQICKEDSLQIVVNDS